MDAKKLSREYKSARGLPIREASILSLLDQLGKTEKEVVEFLGEDVAFKDGAFVYFVDLASRMRGWHMS